MGTVQFFFLEGFFFVVLSSREDLSSHAWETSFRSSQPPLPYLVVRGSTLLPGRCRSNALVCRWHVCEMTPLFLRLLEGLANYLIFLGTGSALIFYGRCQQCTRCLRTLSRTTDIEYPFLFLQRSGRRPPGTPFHLDFSNRLGNKRPPTPSIPLYFAF